MKKEKILKDVKTLIFWSKESLKTSELSEQSRFKEDLDFDSLEFAELIVKCEKKFNIELPKDVFKQVTKISELVNHIAFKCSSSKSIIKKKEIKKENPIIKTSFDSIKTIEDYKTFRKEVKKIERKYETAFNKNDVSSELEEDYQKYLKTFRDLQFKTLAIKYVGKTTELVKKGQIFSPDLSEVSKDKISTFRGDWEDIKGIDFEQKQ